MNTPQDRRAHHRAAIRNTILTAAHDMNDMRWEPQDDALLDVIDDWLGKLEGQDVALVNFKQAIAEESAGNSSSNPPQMPKAYAGFESPTPKFLHRKPLAESLAEAIS